MGEFHRGLLQVRSPVLPAAAPRPGPQKWTVVDCSEAFTGVMTSLDLELDPGEAPGRLTRDLEASGLLHFPSGRTVELKQIIAKDYANELVFVPFMGKPGVWKVVVGGDEQPFGKAPYEITCFERKLPNQEVTRIGGQWFDPNSQKRVSFSVTHDPVETIILAIVVGVVALVYCGQVNSEPSSTELMSKAKELCGDQGLKPAVPT
jgi:hypothetical protein